MELILKELRKMLRWGKLSRIPFIGRIFYLPFVHALGRAISDYGILTELCEKFRPIATLHDLYSYLAETISIVIGKQALGIPQTNLLCPICLSDGKEIPVKINEGYVIECPQHGILDIPDNQKEFLSFLRLIFTCSSDSPQILNHYFRGVGHTEDAMVRKALSQVLYVDEIQLGKEIYDTATRLCETICMHISHPEVLLYSGKNPTLMVGLHKLVGLLQEVK